MGADDPDAATSTWVRCAPDAVSAQSRHAAGDVMPAAGQAVPENSVRRQRLAVRALIRRGDEVLLARLAPTVSAGGAGRWTLPGGGVDHGEHPEVSLAREMHEETGLQVDIDGILGVFSRRFVGRAPGGGVEDYHGIHLIYGGTTQDPGQEPRVVEIDGTTDAVAWTDVNAVRSGAVPVADVVIFAMDALLDRLK